MQLTFKAIARSAGYRAREYGTEGRWKWVEAFTECTEVSARSFATEMEAYRDCCVKAGLIRTLQNGDIVS